MKVKIIHLEDDALKQAAIARVIKCITKVEIDWVDDMASGLEKINEAMENGNSYDLAISDMYYPLSKGEQPDSEAGNYLIDVIEIRNIKLPVIICSSINIKNKNAYGCVWYNEKRDWETELQVLINEFINKHKNS